MTNRRRKSVFERITNLLPNDATIPMPTRPAPAEKYGFDDRLAYTLSKRLRLRASSVIDSSSAFIEFQLSENRGRISPPQ